MFLHHVESPPLAIGEMVRILKPGGVLVITDMDEHGFDFLITEQYDRWAGFARSDISEWFLGAGLREVEVGPVGST
jgi:ubiquinone/menaquinone biosynthesis C-methylase UbiE